MIKQGAEVSVTELREWMTPFDPLTIASEIEEAIQEDLAGSTEAINIYRLLFRHGSNTTPKNGPMVIRRENFNYTDPELSEMMPNEGPHPKGLLNGTRRHLEIVMKTTVGERAEVMRVLRDENRELREQLREFQKSYLTTIEMQQSLLDRAQDRAISARKAAHFEEMKATVVKFILPMIPTIINAMSRSRGLPEVESPAVAMVKGFVMGMSTEDLQALLAHFGPMRLAPILELAKTWQADHQRSEEAVKQFMNEVTPRMPSGDGPIKPPRDPAVPE